MVPWNSGSHLVWDATCIDTFTLCTIHYSSILLIPEEGSHTPIWRNIQDFVSLLWPLILCPLSLMFLRELSYTNKLKNYRLLPNRVVMMFIFNEGPEYAHCCQCHVPNPSHCTLSACYSAYMYLYHAHKQSLALR